MEKDQINLIVYRKPKDDKTLTCSGILDMFYPEGNVHIPSLVKILMEHYYETKQHLEDLPYEEDDFPVIVGIIEKVKAERKAERDAVTFD
jgi:hypothetical protein